MTREDELMRIYLKEEQIRKKKLELRKAEDLIVEKAKKEAEGREKELLQKLENINKEMMELRYKLQLQEERH